MNRSKVIILDEPTSAIDANAEFELFENFANELVVGRPWLSVIDCQPFGWPTISMFSIRGESQRVAPTMS